MPVYAIAGFEHASIDTYKRVFRVGKVHYRYAVQIVPEGWTVEQILSSERPDVRTLLNMVEWSKPGITMNLTPSGRYLYVNTPVSNFCAVRCRLGKRCNCELELLCALE